MMQTTITIGRNVGRTPMSADRWQDFQGRISTIVEVLFPGVDQVFTYAGRGEWDGVEEESATFHVLHDGSATPKDFRWIKAALSKASGDFDQDAIALSTGESELVTR